MSAYDYALSDCFPYVVEVKDEVAIKWAAFLVWPEGHATNGSSFAITSDGREGHKKFWLSEVSHKRVTGWAG